MSRGEQPDERRRNRRLDGSRIAVSLRPRGRLSALPARALDFSRYGIAVHAPAPLPRDVVVFLALHCGELRIENVVGAVHNCVRQGEEYRIGIRFRPTSSLQLDQEWTRRSLHDLERLLEGAPGRSA